MGDIADMILNGTLCVICGEFMGDDESFESPGYPQSHPGCITDNQDDEMKDANQFGATP